LSDIKQKQNQFAYSVKIGSSISESFWLGAALMVLFVIHFYNFLLFHSLAELFSILVAFSIFVLAWKTQRFMDNGYLLFIGVAFLFVGLIDLIHTLAYKGMGVFPGFDTNLPTQLWIAARYLQALSTLLALFFLKRRASIFSLGVGFAIFVSFLLLSIFYWGIFPDSYIEGVGLTPFKRISEYIIAVIFLASAAIVYRQKEAFDEGVMKWLLMFLFASTLSELAFTDYVNVYGFANMFGHLLKIVAFYFIFKSIVETGLERPYDILFRQLKQSEDELRRSESRLRRLVDSDAIGVIFTDRLGNIIDVNDAFLSLLGMSREEYQSEGLHWSELTPPEYSQLDEDAFKEALHSERMACTPYEKEFFRKEGTRVPVLVGFALLEDSRTDRVCFVLDVTERKKAEASTLMYAKELERANQELKDFAFIASHDLQEPLRKIQAFGERFKSQYNAVLDDEGISYLERMNNAARRLQLMIQDLLAYSRVTTRSKTYKQVNLAEIAAEVISDLEVAIETTKGRVFIEELPYIEADALQMRQLLQNLISNALKFHQKGVPPVVHLTGQLEYSPSNNKTVVVRINIIDNGIGFDQNFADRIFQPFQRLVGRTEYEGSGIGLAICRKIVERHSGSITADSIKGQGTTFTIILPVAQTKSAFSREQEIGEIYFDEEEQLI
jgi:PAS domain S-box-containing protein